MDAKPRLGVVDLGTNSIRFAVFEADGQDSRCIHREKVMLRPGKGVFLNGQLQKGVMRDITNSMTTFRRRADLLAVSHMEAFATCALREAENSEELIHKVQRQTGVTIQVISGRREAQLIARGILQYESQLRGSLALVDIGGGSTEISLVRDREVVASVSLKAGAARLHQMFLKGSPPRASDGGSPVVELRRYVRAELARHEEALRRIPVRRILGSSGTLKSLAKALDPDGQRKNSPSPRRPRFSKSDLREFIERIEFMTVPQIRRIPRLEPKRADIILAGALLAEEIMLFFKISQVQTTRYSLRDGLMAEWLNHTRKFESLPPWPVKKKKRKKKALKKKT